MTRMFPSQWVWILLLAGVAQCVFPSLLPRASHWWLTSLGLFCVVRWNFPEVNRSWD
jgi:hypothetical protein